MGLSVTARWPSGGEGQSLWARCSVGPGREEGGGGGAMTVLVQPARRQVATGGLCHGTCPGRPRWWRGSCQRGAALGPLPADGAWVAAPSSARGPLREPPRVPPAAVLLLQRVLLLLRRKQVFNLPLG